MDVHVTGTGRETVLPWSWTALIWSALMLACGLIAGWLGTLAWALPEDGTDAGGMLAMSCFALAAMALVASVVLGAYAVWRRLRPPRYSCTPMWHLDPWHEAQWRFWDGRGWTDFTA